VVREEVGRERVDEYTDRSDQDGGEEPLRVIADAEATSEPGQGVVGSIPGTASP
jgi:hypothetical protein